MKYIQKNSSLIIFSTALVFLLSGCILDDTSTTKVLGQTTTDVTSPTITDTNTTETFDESVAETTVYGKVTDTAGNPIAGVTLSTEKGIQAETDNTGYYTMKVPMDTSSITASFKNYTQNGKAITLEDNASIMLDLVLKPVDKVTRFYSTAGITVSVKGASVTIPNDALVTTDGIPYEGEVRMTFSYNRVTSTPGARIFPGDYTGIALDGSRSNIRSYGFIEVTLEGSDGEAVNLAKDKRASISYPLDTNIVDPKKETPPASIPLWYYDTKKGSWVEEGAAKYDQTTNTYTGTVRHFTVWNLDAKFDGAKLIGCVEDINGNRVPDSYLTVATAGWTKNNHNIDENGMFTFINVPSETSMEIYAVSGEKASTPATIKLDPGEVLTMSSCLILDKNVSSVHSQIKGRVTKSSGEPLSDIYLNIYDKDYHHLGGLYSGSDGYFQSDNFIRPSDNTVIVSAYIFNVSIENTFVLDSNHLLTDIGTMLFQVMDIKGCVERPDGNHTFNGNTVIHKQTPFGEWVGSLKKDGYFTVTIPQSNTLERLYFFTDVVYDNDTGSKSFYLHTKEIEFYADQDTLLMDSCIVLEDAQTSNKTIHVSISSDEPEHYIGIVRNQSLNIEYPEAWGEVLVGKVECSNTTTVTNTGSGCRVVDPTHNTSYTMDKNAVYYVTIDSTNRDKPVSGSMTLAVDGKEYSITIPSDDTDTTEWIAFAIEVYQGDYTVHVINRSGFQGEGLR